MQRTIQMCFAYKVMLWGDAGPCKYFESDLGLCKPGSTVVSKITTILKLRRLVQRKKLSLKVQTPSLCQNGIRNICLFESKPHHQTQEQFRISHYNFLKDSQFKKQPAVRATVHLLEVRPENINRDFVV